MGLTGSVGSGVFHGHVPRSMMPSDAFSSVRRPDGHRRNPDRSRARRQPAPGSQFARALRPPRLGMLEDARGSLEGDDAVTRGRRTRVEQRVVPRARKVAARAAPGEDDPRSRPAEAGGSSISWGRIKEVALEGGRGSFRSSRVAAHAGAVLGALDAGATAHRDAEGAAQRDGQPRQRVGATGRERPRTLGRDPAAPCGRDGRQCLRALRLRDRNTTSPPRRAASGPTSSSSLARRKDRGSSMRSARARPYLESLGCDTDEARPRQAARPRAAGARPRHEALREELLVAASTRRPSSSSSSCPARPFLSAALEAGSVADRGRSQPAGDHRDADHADRACCARSRTAGARRQSRSRPKVISDLGRELYTRPRHAHRPFRKGRTWSRDRSEVLQRDRRLASRRGVLPKRAGKFKGAMHLTGRGARAAERRRAQRPLGDGRRSFRPPTPTRRSS